MPGTVFDHGTLNTGRGRTSYRLTLDYKPPVGETTYHKEFIVSEVIYNQALQARQAPVTYLPSEPERSAVGNDFQPDTEPLAIGGALILFALAVSFFLRWQVKRVQGYLFEGSGTN